MKKLTIALLSTVLVVGSAQALPSPSGYMKAITPNMTSKEKAEVKIYNEKAYKKLSEASARAMDPMNDMYPRSGMRAQIETPENGLAVRPDRPGRGGANRPMREMPRTTEVAEQDKMMNKRMEIQKNVQQLRKDIIASVPKNKRGKMEQMLGQYVESMARMNSMQMDRERPMRPAMNSMMNHSDEQPIMNSERPMRPMGREVPVMSSNMQEQERPANQISRTLRR
jgi:hypothetical protein